MQKSACKEMQRRLTNFLPAEAVPAPGSCYDDPSKETKLTGDQVKQSSSLRFVLATFPDPVHTHFSLLFDRVTDALQYAAQDEDYIYDSSWLPWRDKHRQYDTLSDQQTADGQQSSQEKQPGILVFRKALPSSPLRTAAATTPSSVYDEGLVVFLVGENPTGGIDQDQFKNAIAWISVLRPQGTESSIRILGPYFSGSFPSLERLLLVSDVANFLEINRLSITLPTNAPSSTQISPVKVFSGSTSSSDGIDWFTEFLKKSSLHGQFLAFQENDDLAIARYCAFIKGRGYSTTKLAIVSEDETAYGLLSGNSNSSPPLPECNERPRDESPEPNGPIYLYYPRDIASLRSAYGQQASTINGQQNRGQPVLPDDLAEPSDRERDTIRAYGGGQNPLSQEAILFAMANLMKAHDIQFILLRSSNTLDEIFLTRFFNRVYPDARVVLTHADLLFRRSAETAGFRGTMMLTTYPLLTWEQDWTVYPRTRHRHRIFPESSAEGVYIAGRYLLDSDNLALPDGTKANPLTTTPASVVIQDYGPPQWLRPQDHDIPSRPPTWISVVGYGQLWPVAVLDEKTLCLNHESSLPFAHTDASYLPAQLTLPLLTIIILGLSAIWSVWHLCCCAAGSRRPTRDRLASGSLAYFAPMTPQSSLQKHRILILLGCVMVALWPTLLASLSGAFSSGGGVSPALFQFEVFAWWWVRSPYWPLFVVACGTCL